MIDAIDILLQDKQHPDVQTLLDFHHAYRDFLPRVVAEFRLLKKQLRKSGSAKAVFYYLRWVEEWRGIKVNDHIRPLAVRACLLLWPDVNGFVEFHHHRP